MCVHRLIVCWSDGGKVKMEGILLGCVSQLISKISCDFFSRFKFLEGWKVLLTVSHNFNFTEIKWHYSGFRSFGAVATASIGETWCVAGAASIHHC